jgi:hypothetical protein
MQISSQLLSRIVNEPVVYFTSDGGHRHAPRAEAQLNAKLSLGDEQDGPGVPVEVVEISARGAALFHSAAFRVGQQIVLTFDAHGDEEPVAIACAVRQCHREGDQFRMGVEYVRVM